MIPLQYLTRCISLMALNHFDTKITHLGRDSAKKLLAVNPPLVRASTTTFATLAEFKESYKGIAFETPRYGRSGTNTEFELQAAMAAICNTETCIATSCGLSACAAVIGAYSEAGGSPTCPIRSLWPNQVISRICFKPT